MWAENFNIQTRFRKGRGTRNQIVNTCWIIEKAREFERNIHCLFDYTKAFDCMDHSKLWKIVKQMGKPDLLTCLLRSLYAGKEATVRTRRGKMACFKIGKGVHHGCILSQCLFSLYAEYIMWNAGLDELQPGIKIARRSIYNLKNADDITTVAESKEELKSLDESERGEWKSWF